MPRALVIHGPNLNLLGTREPEIYGTATLSDVDAMLREWAEGRGWDVVTWQSNHEGAIIDRLQQARGEVAFILLNPGGFTHSSYAIRDAVAAMETPVIEVHLSNVHARESFRRRSVIAPACRGQISGLGPHSYLAALEAGARMFGGER